MSDLSMRKRSSVSFLHHCIRPLFLLTKTLATVLLCVFTDLPGQFPSLKLCFCRLQRQSLTSRAGYELSPLQLVLGWREAALLLKTSYIRARPR